MGEGWLDLKAYNGTDNIFQIEVRFDDSYMYGRVLSRDAVELEYSVFNKSVSYRKKGEKTYQTASVCRTETDKSTGRQTERELYVNQCEIAYRLPEGIKIEDEQ